MKFISSDIDDDVQSLQEFTADLIVEGTSRFVKAIKHDVDLPHKLPPGMSARFRIGTSLADAVKVSRSASQHHRGYCAKSLQGKHHVVVQYMARQMKCPLPPWPGPPCLDPPPLPVLDLDQIAAVGFALMKEDLCLHDLWKTRRIRKNRRHYRQGT